MRWTSGCCRSCGSSFLDHFPGQFLGRIGGRGCCGCFCRSSQNRGSRNWSCGSCSRGRCGLGHCGLGCGSRRLGGSSGSGFLHRSGGLFSRGCFWRGSRGSLGFFSRCCRRSGHRGLGSNSRCGGNFGWRCRNGRSRRRSRSRSQNGAQAFYLGFRSFFHLGHQHERCGLGQHNGNGRAHHKRTAGSAMRAGAHKTGKQHCRHQANAAKHRQGLEPKHGGTLTFRERNVQ